MIVKDSNFTRFSSYEERDIWLILNDHIRVINSKIDEETKEIVVEYYY